MKFAIALLVGVLLFVPVTSQAHTWLVRQDGTGDCTTIQACCDSASWYDTVLVSPGIYSEHVLVQRGVVLVSEQGPSVTVITAPSVNGPAARAHVNTVVEGFTLRDGHSGNPPAGGADIMGGTLRNCLVTGSTSFGYEGPGYAGGVGVWSGGVIEGNTIVSNGSWVIAGGIYCFSSFSGQIVRNVVVANTSGYGIYCESGASPTFVCNNVWGNAEGEYGGACGDQTGLNGNVSVDPLFCDPDNNDYTLHANSPCLNAPGCGLIGAFGQGCPSTSVNEYLTTWGRIKVLFR